MSQRLLDTEDVLNRVGYSLSWLQTRIEEGTFPKPIHKWRRNKWLERDVDEWILKNFGGDQASQPTPEATPAAH